MTRLMTRVTITDIPFIKLLIFIVLSNNLIEKIDLI